ncbi:hypothetical protein D3C85_1667800 [compost metagenome]
MPRVGHLVALEGAGQLLGNRRLDAAGPAGVELANHLLIPLLLVLLLLRGKLLLAHLQPALLHRHLLIGALLRSLPVEVTVHQAEALGEPIHHAPRV